MKKWIKITLIAAAVLAVLIVIAAIAVSPVAKNYIEKHDRELIGRSIRMERLRMNIFTGRLRIEGLRIGGSEDSTTFFRLDSFEMRMRLWPLLGNRVLVKKISFAGPDVKIYQRATRLPSPQRPKSRRNRGKSGFTTSRSATAGSFTRTSRSMPSGA